MFELKTIFWIVLMFAIGICWCIDHQRLKKTNNQLKVQILKLGLEQEKNELHEFEESEAVGYSK